MNSELNILLEIVENLLANKISCEDARQRIECLSMKEFPSLYGNLHHYFEDNDIREKDLDYQAFQAAELKKLVHHLKAGDIQKANGISFLHAS